MLAHFVFSYFHTHPIKKFGTLRYSFAKRDFEHSKVRYKNEVLTMLYFMFAWHKIKEATERINDQSSDQ